MDRVYVVTTWDGSDFTVSGVFTRPELAQAYRRAKSFSGHLCIVGVAVDPPCPPVAPDGLYSFYGWMHKTEKNPTGELVTANNVDFCDFIKGKDMAHVWNGSCDSIGVFLLAADKDKALEILSEKRISLLLAGKWPTVAGYIPAHSVGF